MAFGQFDAGTDESEFNAFSFLIQQALLKIQTATLVKVVAVHGGGGVAPTGNVDVQPMVNQMTGDRVAVPHGTIYSVPFFRLQGGPSAVIADPVAGDIGVCVFASRDISTVKNTKAVANPGSQRTYDWADGLYLGGLLNGAPTQYLQFLGGSIKAKTPMLQTSGNLSVGSGYTGTFTTPTGNVVTVQDGIITNID